MKNRKWIVTVILLIAVLAAASILYPELSARYGAHAEEEADVRPWGDAPDFFVTDKDGNTVYLSDGYGKPAVVNFWATWCPYCVQELPVFEQYYKLYGDRVNFMIIDLTDGYRETKQVADAYIAKYGYTFPVYYDDSFSASDSYGIYNIPVTMFIDAEGNFASGYIGVLNEAAFRLEIERLIRPALEDNK